MLGLSAAEIYGFEVEALKPIADRIGPTPEDLGQCDRHPEAEDLVKRWAPIKEVGRHWLTGKEFPLFGELSEA